MSNLIVKNTEEHLNFKCALVALSVTGQALENFTEDKLQAVHDTISKKLGVMLPCNQQCSCKHRDVIKWCSTCDSWRRELQSYISAKHRNTSWKKMQSWTWPVQYRNIAEVFVAADWNSSNLNLQDVSTILSIWQRCAAFPNHIVQFSKSLQKARNNLFHIHSSKLVMTDKEKTKLFQAVYKVVNHGDIIQFIQNHNEVIKAIKALEKGDLHGHEAEALKALADIAGTNKEMLAKLDNFQSNLDRLERREKMNRTLVFFVITVLLCLMCTYFPNQTITSGDVLRMDGHEAYQKNERRSCLSEKPYRLFKAGINMEGYLEQGDGFVGRRWLFDAIEERTINVSTRRGVVMFAEMGYGKSAIVKHIVCAKESDFSYTLRKRLIAYHICRFDVQLSKKSNTFIKRMSSMIAQTFSEFAHVLESDKACLENYDSDTCEQDPFGCMDQCLIDPLCKVQFSQTETNIIVIDALDECEDKNGQNIIFDLLDSDRIKRLPSMFKFIITSRNVSAYYALDSAFSFMMLRDNDDMNLQDIRSYIQASELPIETLNRLASLRNISNFLLISNILKNKEVFGNKEPLPKSLYKYYGQQFKRIFGSHYDQPKSVLEILCATHSPPTEDYVLDITRHTTKISTKQYEAIAHKFQHILKFIGKDLHFSHMSLKTWLVTDASGVFRLDIKRGHMRHARYLLEKLHQNITVDPVDIAIHISYASSMGKLMGIFHRLQFSKLKRDNLQNDDFPLHRLVQRCDCDTAMELLFYHFREVNETDQAGMSPLYIAAALGRTNIFLFLIKNNADINFRLKSYSKVIHLELAARIAFEDRHWGYGIMDIASQNNHKDIITNILLTDIIVKKYHFYKMNGLNLLPIHLACKIGHINVVKTIVEHIGSMLDYWCLYYASESGNADIVKFAVEHGIEDTCRACPENLYWVPENKTRVQGNKIISKDGYSLQDYILFDDWNLIMCETALHAAVRNNKPAVANILISQSINALNCVDRAGRTPLVSAVVFNCHEIVEQTVLRYGFDVNLKCKLTETIADISQLSEMEHRHLQSAMCETDLPVLHTAAKYNRRWLFDILRRNGVKWKEIPRDNDGCHFAHTAACHGSIDVLKFIKFSLDEMILQLLCKNFSDPLISASVCGSVETVNYLIENENQQLNSQKVKHASYILSTVMVNIPMETADTAADTAEKSLSIIEIFIANGLQLSVTDQYQRNIFHYAIANGHYKLVSRLLSLLNREDKKITSKDIYGKIPVFHALEKLPLTNIVQFFLFPNYTEHFHQLSASLTPQEYSCFIALTHMRNNKILEDRALKRVEKLLIQKRRLALFTAVSLYIEQDQIFDHGILKYIKIQDKSKLFLLTYVSSVLIRLSGANATVSFLTKHLIWFKQTAACTKYSIPCTLHDIARLCNFKIIMPNFNFSSVLNDLIIESMFNDVVTDLLKESFDYDGYNILERAIQGRNIDFVKHFVKKKIELNKNPGNVLLSTMVNDSTDSIVSVFRGIRNDSLILEIQDKDAVLRELIDEHIKSQAEKAKLTKHLIINNYDIMKGYYRDIHDRTDSVMHVILTSNKKNISKEFICSPNARNFSFVHLVAMQGYTQSLKVIREYWGSAILECPNIDNFTPMYLARVFDNQEIIKYLEKHQVATYIPKRDAEMHFIFKIWSRFLLNRSNKTNIHCLYRLKSKRMWKRHVRLKAYRCMKYSARSLGIFKTVKDDLEFLKSSVVFTSNVDLFIYYYNKIINLIRAGVPDDMMLRHDIGYYYQKASFTCRIAGKAYAKFLYVLSQTLSMRKYEKESIGLMAKRLVDDASIQFQGDDLTFEDCAQMCPGSTESTCIFRVSNIIKAALSSEKIIIGNVITKLLSEIAMTMTHFYSTSKYFSDRIKLDGYFASGVWILDHHVYTYMNIIKDMKFFQDAFLMNGGLLSEFLRLSQEIKKSLDYVQWSNNAIEIANMFHNERNHG